MALSQALLQKQLQKLSPQQIQLMKLLQIPTANLEQRIKDEMEENPALEQGENEAEDEYKEEYNQEAESNFEDDEPTGSEEEYDNIDITEYVHEGDDEIADYRTRDDGYGEMEEKQDIFSTMRLRTIKYSRVSQRCGRETMTERS